MHRRVGTKFGISVILAVLAAAPLSATAQQQFTVYPVSLYVAGRDTTHVTLGWSSNGAYDNWNQVDYVPATSFELRMSTVGLITNSTSWNNAVRVGGEPAPAAPGTWQTLQVMGLRQATNYYFAIKAFVGADSSDLPGQGCVVTTVADPIAPAGIDTLAVVSAGDSGVELTWTAPGDDGFTGQATKYDLRYSTNGPIMTLEVFYEATRSTSPIVPVAANTLQTVFVDGLAPATTYWFAVRAADEVDNWSPLSSTSLEATTTPPDRGSDHGGSNCGGAATGRSGLIALLPLLAALSAHRWVRAKFGIAAILALLAATPLSATAQEIAVNPVYLGSSGWETTYITLDWQAPFAYVHDGGLAFEVPVTSYELRKSTAGPITDSASWENAERVGGEPRPEASDSVQTLQVTGLRQNTFYYFAMRAFVDADPFTGAPATSSDLPDPCCSVKTITDSIAPAGIDTLAVVSAGDSGVELTWTAPGDDGFTGLATKYDVRYSTSGPITTLEAFNEAARSTSPIVPVTPNTPQTEFVDGLAPATTYWFAVRAADEVDNWSPLSSTSLEATTTPPDRGSDHGGSNCGGSATGRGIGPVLPAFLLAVLSLMLLRNARD